MFARTGWEWLDVEVTDARTEVAVDGRSASVRLEWRDPRGTAGRADATVEVARVLPVLVCGAPPEAAEKSSPELALRTLFVS